MTAPADYGISRPSFQLDPELDSKIFVGRSDVKERLENRLRRAILTGTSMHTIIYGEYGSGKTHTLNYIRKFLEEQKMSVLSIYVRSPRIEERSRPSDLFSSIIGALSPVEIFALFTKIYDSVQTETQKTQDVYQRIAILEKVVGNRDLSHAIYRYIMNRPSEDYLVVKWLSGEKLAAKEKSTLGVIQDNSDPFAAVQTLLTLLQLFNRFDNKYALLLLDEMETLRIVGSKRLMEFENFIRPLVEEKSGVSVIISFTSHVGLEDALPIFQSTTPIGTRVGYPQNYMYLKPFDDPDSMKQFITELLANVRNPKADIKSLVKSHKKDTDEALSEEFFPFTRQAIDFMFQAFSQTAQPKPLLPRDILKTMTDCLGDAIAEDTVTISTEIVSRVLKE